MLGVSPVERKLSEKLSRAIEAIGQLRRHHVRGKPKPHKLVLLLAVADLYEDGLIWDNRIYLNAELERRFCFYFKVVAGPHDWCQIGLPFFHLRSSGFWFHKVPPGRKLSYESLRTPGGGKENVLRNVEYAYLADYMAELMMERETRRALREAIVNLLIQESPSREADRLRVVRYRDDNTLV